METQANQLTEDEVLSCCDETFAAAWRARDAARPLFGELVDSMMLVIAHSGGTALLAMKDSGCNALFGDDFGSETNDLFMRIRRSDRKKFMEACQAAIETGRRQHLEASWVNAHVKEVDSTADDNLMYTEMTVCQVGCYGDDPILFFAVHNINGVRRRDRAQVRSQFRSLRALFDEIFLLDLDTGETEPVWLGGRPLIDESGREVPVSLHTVFSTVHPDDSRLFWKNANYQYIRDGLFGDSPLEALTCDLRRRGEDGEYHWTRMFMSSLESGGDHAMVLVCSQNIDAQMEAQRRERELLSRAQTDGLTGVYNHGTSEELIRARIQSLRAGDRAIFCIVDVDNFKGVNDRYGHQVGDEVLKLVAGSLKSMCRDEDIVGRFGGDEFVMLSTGANMPSLESLKARFECCKRKILEGSQALGMDPPATASIGVVGILPGDYAYSTIFNAADELLYQVKRGGKNGFRYASFSEVC